MTEDLVQDIFVKLWQNGLQLGVRSKFSAYLYTTVRNKAIDHLRKIGDRGKLAKGCPGTHVRRGGGAGDPR
ncbi:RNA polymerase sigma factor [Terrimonas ginsenosidimutans]|uniref:RNA polymerase sigma factor n=1 Tax=Terrimonas ginsenosidimutans TaxID=2908004 RepID=UPI003D793293